MRMSVVHKNGTLLKEADNFTGRLSQQYYKSVLSTRRNSELGIKQGVYDLNKVQSNLAGANHIDLIQPILDTQFKVQRDAKKLLSKDFRYKKSLHKNIDSKNQLNLKSTKINPSNKSATAQAQPLKIVG